MAPGTAPELIVNATGLMTFGAQNMQTAKRHDHVMFGGTLRPCLFQLGRIARIVAAEFTGFAGQKFGIASQQDVGATAGHIGGDGQRPLTPGLGHDFGFALMILSI